MKQYAKVDLDSKEKTVSEKALVKCFNSTTV